MGYEQKRLYKVYRAGGRSFPVYIEYDGQLDESHPVYPDFEKQPEYTGEGRPFATAEQNSCPHCKPGAPGKPPPGDCGGCGWFYRERTPYDPIGVCMCEEFMRKSEQKIRETKSESEER
jgi:hypothetical protein